MGFRRRLFELVNGKLPSWASASLKYQGLVEVLDSELSGHARFARRLGHPLPVWVVDTSTQLLVDVQPSDQMLTVTPLSWIQPGVRLRLDNRYDVIVDDVSDGNIHLTTPVGAAFPAGTDVTIFSSPVIVSGDYSANTDTFVFHSSVRMYRGDVVVFSAHHEIELENICVQGTTPDGLYIYMAFLKEAVTEAIADGTVISVRAYPAYESNTLLVPKQPFVIDSVSGVFYEDMDDVKETTTVFFRDESGTVILESPEAKNTAVFQMDLPVDMLLFGRRDAGIVKWDTTLSALVMMPDAQGYGHIHYDFTPAWETGIVDSWTVTVETTGAARVLIHAGDTKLLSVDLPANASTPLRVPFPTQPLATLHLRIYAQDPTTQVRFRSWTATDKTRIRMLSYVTVAQVSGPWLWGSTGLLGKRNLRLSDVTAYADARGALSSGFLVA